MKKSKLVALAGVTVISSLFAVAQAGPVQVPKCKTPNIKIPVNGAGVLFNENCTTAYVLPPVAGESALAALAQNSNLTFCPTVMNAGVVAKATLDSAGIIAGKVKTMIEDFKPLEQDIIDLRYKSAEQKAKRDAAESKAEKASTRQDMLTDEVGKANKSATRCKALAADPAKECKTEEAAVLEAKATLRAHITDVLDPAEEAFEEADLAYSKTNNRLLERNKIYADSIEPLLDLQAKLSTLQVSVSDLYKQYTPLEGATGQLVYSVPWDKLVQDFRAANPGLNLTWTRMPVKDAMFTASVRLGEEFDASLPAVLWSRIPGAVSKGPATPASGEIKIGPEPSVPSGRNIADVAIGFGNSVSGQVALALTGACPFFPNGADASKTNVDFRGFSANLVGNVVYDYEVAVRRGYTANYHLSALVSRIEQNTKKGGWFSSKNIHSIVEENQSPDWFSIKFHSEADEFQYTAQEQSDISRDVKASLIDRALKNLASINGLNSTPPGLPPEPGPSGVGAAAANLRKGCYWNYYCLAASYTLSTLDSIFGSKQSVSNFKKSNNVWTEDKVDGVRIVERSSSFTFRPVEEIR